jgi:hypothetical protein
MNALTPAAIEPAQIEIERCELCGCAIEDLEELIYLRAADLVRQWELNDPRDRWRHTGERRPFVTAEARPRESYTPPQSTVDAFQYVLRLDDPDYLARWLADHPADAPALFEIWKSKSC